MQLGFLGVTYKDAQMDIRDKTAFTEAGKLAFFQEAKRAGIMQCMILSTCNRSEVYYMFEEEEQKEQAERIYHAMFSDVDLTGCIRKLAGKEAMAYLFRVAAGLESLVLGEDQILGQVKEAMDDARTMGYSGKELNKIVRDAITCAKKIKRGLKISEKPLSVSSIGVRRLNEACGIAGKKILVIGSGKAAFLALKYICAYPQTDVTACSRNDSHAKRLRGEFPAIQVISYGAWRSVIAACDIVVCATSSPHPILKKDTFSPVRNMTLLDLAAPRDVDAALAEHPCITLINLDTLQAIATENQNERKRLVEEGRLLIEQELKGTTDWCLQSRMDDTIASLQQRCDTIAADSFSYLNRKMELDPREQRLLKKTLHASLLRLLREPIQELKRLDCKEEQEACERLMQQLFQIEKMGEST